MASISYGDPFITHEMRRRARVAFYVTGILAISIAINVALAMKLIRARHDARIESGEIVMERSSIFGTHDPNGRPPIYVVDRR